MNSQRQQTKIPDSETLLHIIQKLIKYHDLRMQDQELTTEQVRDYVSVKKRARMLCKVKNK